MSGAHVWILGSGGREAALAQKLSESARVQKVTVLPGNAGLTRLGFECLPARLEDRRDFEDIGARALESGVDLIVVGPDDPIALGCGDVLREMGLKVFCPSAGAARLEASKAFAKACMIEAGVPTARSELVTDFQIGIRKLKEHFQRPNADPIVLKADGLARGKGVSVCSTLAFAMTEWERIFKFGYPVLIEEWISGVEVSQMILTNGDEFAFLPSAQDTKRLSPEPESPNTGGMGAVCPVAWAEDDRFRARLKLEVFEPILKHMRERGTPFAGCLYAGLMVDREKDRFWVLEFNVRFGDPETQVILDRVESDLYPVIEACAVGARLPNRDLTLREGVSIVVVGATERYPEGSGPEAPIALDLTLEEEREHLRYAGVKEGAERALIASGGRVLGVIGRGKTPALASAEADRVFSRVTWRGLKRRFDIGSEPLVVLASGRGGNFEAIVRAVNEGTLQSARVVALGVDHEGVGAVERAARLRIPVGVFPGFGRGGEERKKAEAQLAVWIRSLGVRTVVLAGFKWKLGQDFLKGFWDRELGRFRVVNIHPSLLPKYPGLNSYQKAYDARESETGVTIHWVDEGLDTGEVIEQYRFLIEDLVKAEAGAEAVEARGLEIEYALYPRVLERIFKKY